MNYDAEKGIGEWGPNWGEHFVTSWAMLMLSETVYSPPSIKTEYFKPWKYKQETYLRK